MGIVLIVSLAMLVLVDTTIIGVALYRGSTLAARSEPFQRPLPDAASRLLILGDSTAVGTGAEHPADSVAGRIGALLPRLSIVNQAADGARARALLAQLRTAPAGRYDAILIQVGGNDILRFTGLAALRATLDELLPEAMERGDSVVMLSTGDVGSAPAIPWPVSRLYSWRSRQVRALLLETTSRWQVDYVDLYDPAPDNPFRRSPGRYYAVDGLHPSGAGYGLWFERLRSRSPLLDALSERPPAPDG